MLRINNLHFGITGVPILNGITFAVEEAETIGIIGPNGSGKTTLFNCLNGFVIAQQGSIGYRGQDITNWPPHQRAHLGLGRVFQNFGVFRDMTILENIIIALESHQPLAKIFFPWTAQSKRNKVQALELLSNIRLADRADDKAGSLSGGQLRLLEIVRALAFGADLFLLDEPTAGVAPKMKEDVALLISNLQKLGKTVLVIEHDINFIQSFCSRILVLDVGRIVLDDTPKAVRQNELLKEIYFGRDGGDEALA